MPSSRVEELAHLDPHRIYIENVRSVLGVSTAEAIAICENAVRQGLFEKGIEVRCPDGGVAASAKTEQELPPTVYCWVDEDGHVGEVERSTADLAKAPFYVLK